MVDEPHIQEWQGSGLVLCNRTRLFVSSSSILCQTALIATHSADGLARIVSGSFFSIISIFSLAFLKRVSIIKTLKQHRLRAKKQSPIEAMTSPEEVNHGNKD
jgi:hypothetical protein